MSLPSTVQALLDAEFTLLQHSPEQAFLPARRLAIYAAFGPTYASSSFEERIARIRAGQIMLTRADRVRARLALLTAQHVVPLWFAALDEAQLLTADRITDAMCYAFRQITLEHGATHIQEALDALFASGPISIEQLHVALNQLPANTLDLRQRSVLEEYVVIGETVATVPSIAEVDIVLNPALAEVRSIYTMPIVAWPAHILELTQGVLEQRIATKTALTQSGDIYDALGNLFEEDMPAQAHDVGMALAEALSQSVGLGPFDHQAITPSTTEEWLLGRGAAAAAALKAYSGVFDGIYATEEYDLEKRRSFWEWWATEAIPQAWSLEGEAEEPAASETMPFEQTVQVMAYRTGITVSFEETPPESMT